MATILLVEQDPAARINLLSAMRALGHIAHGRENGRLALQLLQARPDFDLLVTSAAQPGMDGVELLRAAAMTRPGLPAILVVDARFDPARNRVPDPERVTLLVQPYTADQLASAVETGLRARRTRGVPVPQANSR